MQRRTVVSVALFVFLVVVGLAGADKPPPPGFLIWILLAGVASLIAWWRAPHWIRPLDGARDGAWMGLLAGVVLASGPGEPSIEVTFWLRALWVVGAVVMAALGGWLLGAVLARRNATSGGQE